MLGTLWVVATPIGNLGDLPPRAAEVLAEVDFIAAEDTRCSLVLLNRFGIKKPLLSYHKFNEKQRGEHIIGRILNGESCALITDAGTPCVSDPGSVLTSMAVKAGITVTGVPGACAAVTALSVSGLPVSSYTFYGFLPRGEKVRKFLCGIKNDSANTAVFYESPNRIKETLSAIGQVFPEGELCVCNDLTKKFETYYRGRADDVLEKLQNNPNAHKGEYTVVLNKNTENRDAPEELSDEASFVPLSFNLSIEARLVDIMAKEGCALREAVARLNGTGLGLTRNDIYAASLKIKKLLG